MSDTAPMQAVRQQPPSQQHPQQPQQHPPRQQYPSQHPAQPQPQQQPIQQPQQPQQHPAQQPQQPQQQRPAQHSPHPGQPPRAQQPPGQESPRRGGPGKLVQGAGLLAVALVAGLVWWFIRSGSEETAAVEPTPTQEDPLTSGAFDYTAVAGPEESDDCEANSYGDLVDWFADHPCERVTRALYTTETDGARALVSVVVVTMPQASDAQQLKAVTDTDGTGNVNDLVRDESVSLPGAPNVAQGEYASRAEDKKVTIVEAAFFGEHTDDELIARIGDDALRLAEAQP